MPTLEKHVVHTSMSIRCKRMARKYGAVLVWVGVAAGLFALVQRQPQYATTPGVAELVQISVAPTVNGVIHELTVDLLDDVRPGQTIAVMDDSLIRAEQATAEAELARLRAQLEANKEELRTSSAQEQRKGMDERRRFAMNEEQSRLDHLQLVAQQESDTVELERLRLVMQREETLIAQKMTTRESYDDARLRYEALHKKVQENEMAIAAAARMCKEAQERQNTLQDLPADLDLERILEPVRKAIAVQEAHLVEMQQHRKGLVLVSPGAGQVVSVLKRDGESVMAGEAVVTLRLANTLRVVAYVNEKTLCDVAVGAHARLFSRYRPQLSTEAEVVRVGAQIEALPPRFQANPSVKEFGLPILLSSLKDQVFYPGECVNVALDLKP